MCLRAPKGCSERQGFMARVPNGMLSVISGCRGRSSRVLPGPLLIEVIVSWMLGLLGSRAS